MSLPEYLSLQMQSAGLQLLVLSPLLLYLLVRFLMERRKR